MNVIAIFILIGVAHWAAHLLQCGQCPDIVMQNFKLLLEGVVCIFGWPFHLFQYVYAAVHAQKGDSKFGKEIRFERKEGEALDEFFERTKKEALEKIKSGDIK